MEYSVTQTISAQQVCDQFVAAFEGGSNYWCQEANYLSSTNLPEAGLVWWGTPEVFAGDFQAEISFDDPDDAEVTKRKIIGPKDVQLGLELMAKGSPKHFAEILHDDGDANTADDFLQHVIFGEVIYS